MKKIFNQIWLTTVSLFTSIFVAAWLLIPTHAYAQSAVPTLEQIDSLSSKSDRWLFLATLVALLLFGAFVVKTLLSQLDKQREAAALATDKLVAHLQNEAKEARVEIANAITQLATVLNKER
jgi:hypothetical protein